MAKFTFSMIHNGIEHKEQIEIPERELRGNHTVHLPGYQEFYRKCAIQTRLEKWAVSHLNLSWEEVTSGDEQERTSENGRTEESVGNS